MPISRELAAEDTASNLPTYSDQEVADYLRTGFWSWFGGRPHAFNLGSDGTSAKDGQLFYNLSGWYEDPDGLTDEGAALARAALQLYGNVLGIDFVETTATGTTVDLFFQDNESGAHSGYTAASGSNGAIVHSAAVNISEDWLTRYGDEIGSYTLQTYIHEIGHALGLGHAGGYDVNANYVIRDDDPDYSNNSNVYLNDSWQMSVMSYFDQRENSTIEASYARLLTPMIADWIALSDMDTYAISAYLGDTVYGFNTTISAEQSVIWNALSDYAHVNAFNIIDSGGTDTVDFSGYDADQTIRLAGGSISDIAGLTGNMTISPGTVIENAVGGDGNDWIIGNDADNVLLGNGGFDTLEGRGGNDTLDLGTGGGVAEGGAGADVLYARGTNAAESLYGGTGDDRLIVLGDLGVGDVYDGGEGRDCLTFDVQATLAIDLGQADPTRVAHVGGTSFVIVGIETINAGSGDDTLSGDADDNCFYGRDGYDTIFGGDGNDSLSGGDGGDALYGGTGNDTLLGEAGNDLLDGGQGFNSVWGGDGNDEIHSSGMGRYFGDAGNDALFSSSTGAGRPEVLDGGDGVDRLDMTAFLTGCEINLATGATAFTESKGDSYQNFENVTTGGGVDRVTGTSGANVILTGGGADVVRAAAGWDRIVGGGGHDRLFGGNGSDKVFGGAGDDFLVGGKGADRLVGGRGDDVYVVQSLRQVVVERADQGHDIVKSDVSFGLTGSARYVEDLSLSGALDLIGRGNGHANRIAGNGGSNILSGRGGDDVLIGRSGADRLIGGAGADLMKGGTGDDTYIVNSASDRVAERAGGGLDTVISSVSLALRGLDRHVENLTLSGKSNLFAMGTGAANALTGNAGDNVLSGRGGNDTVMGRGGDDRMSGGAGSDRFLFRAGDGSDTIIDFDVTTDRLHFQSGAASFDDLTISQSGADALIAYGTGDRILVLDTAASDLTAEVLSF
ncbi:M10 family metallopeptidase C-terminal domain-containing protein [Tropicimonas isoalkanivorans]|uniref:Serralysin n=1 Tax=Tropicimonas isoalkanivorans TaxID=441112 RepID=A0A1I1KC14_9RHOB|nr:M10 family metallopeptidase C-terminal domain-containing protein [Tropicimonas isoalkanivorans]SFC58494.1 serralysin [Tropicimonas isoalkanivorans]